MIPHNRPTFDEEEAEAARQVLKRGWVASGPEVAAFERELAEFLDLPDGAVVMTASGSAALFLVFRALGLAGKRIGIPVYACSALAGAAKLAGGEAVFLDSAADHPGLSKDCPKTDTLDAIVPVFSFGLPCALPASPSRHVILDLAQALGAKMDGKSVAKLSKIGILSFSATKLMTSGGSGGAIFCHDPDIMASIRDFLDFDGRHDREIRFNFRPSDIGAAIGRVQLRKLPGFLARREALFDLYRSAGLPLLDALDSTANPVRYRAVMRVDAPQSLIRALGEAGIRAIIPIEAAEFLDDPKRYPHAAQLAKTTVSLPLYPSLALEDAERIADIARRWI